MSTSVGVGKENSVYFSIGNSSLLFTSAPKYLKNDDVSIFAYMKIESVMLKVN